MEDLKKIKNEYGEKMAHLCRDLFPTALETPGILYDALTKTFNPSRHLYADIMNSERFKESFISIILSVLPKANEEEKIATTKTPQELLDEAGYILYECHSEKDVQSFRHYYKREDDVVPVYKEGEVPIPYSGEELCTFNGNRLSRCRIFFAVKKNVDEIKREDFKNPRRQDEYGTSVISIQFSKGRNNTLSIKNRYNHTVLDPDATFSNNLDNIIPGLTKSFEEYYGLNITSTAVQDVDLPGYVLAEDGRYYKYNYEINGVYYCPDNIIVDFGQVHKYDKSRYLIIDNFILDLKEKTITQYFDYFYTGYNSTTDGFIHAVEQIDSVKIENDPDSDDKIITINNDIIIVINNKNQITKYRNPHLQRAKTRFMIYSKNLEELDLPECEFIDDGSLENNVRLRKLNLPKCRRLGDHFLDQNTCLEELILPECGLIGERVLSSNRRINKVYLPKVSEIGVNFLYENSELEEIDLPNVLRINAGFLYANEKIKRVNLPICYKVGAYFLTYNSNIEELNLPEIQEVGDSFMSFNSTIKKVNMPKLQYIGRHFLSSCIALEEIELPSAEEIGSSFLADSRSLKRISLPKAKRIGSSFLAQNKILKELDLPEAIEIEHDFLPSNTELVTLNIPKCTTIGSNFLGKNTELKELDLPSVEYIADDFLPSNIKLERLTMPRCKTIESDFMKVNTELKVLDISSVETIADKETKDMNTYMNYPWLHFLSYNLKVKLIRDNKEFERRK